MKKGFFKNMAITITRRDVLVCAVIILSLLGEKMLWMWHQKISDVYESYRLPEAGYSIYLTIFTIDAVEHNFLGGYGSSALVEQVRNHLRLRGNQLFNDLEQQDKWLFITSTMPRFSAMKLSDENVLLGFYLKLPGLDISQQVKENIFANIQRHLSKKIKTKNYLDITKSAILILKGLSFPAYWQQHKNSEFLAVKLWENTYEIYLQGSLFDHDLTCVQFQQISHELNSQWARISQEYLSVELSKIVRDINSSLESAIVVNAQEEIMKKCK